MLKNQICALNDSELEAVVGGEDNAFVKFMKNTGNTMWQVPAYAVYPKNETTGSFCEKRKNALKKAVHFDGNDKAAKAAGVVGCCADGAIVVGGVSVVAAGAILAVKKCLHK